METACRLAGICKSQTQAEVSKVFNRLKQELGHELFKRLFEVILTDNGTEFQHREALENDENGKKLIDIYYCDPYRSNQKGALEKNHEYIRYVKPKGSSFADMTEDKTKLLMNHINSEKRDSLNQHSPFELSQLLLDNRLHEVIGLIRIEPDDVNLTPELLK